MIRHCIVDTKTNKVVNVIDYDALQTGTPPGFESEAPHLLCVAHDEAGIGWDYLDGAFEDNRPKPPSTYIVKE
jgi:hypothetical protein